MVKQLGQEVYEALTLGWDSDGTGSPGDFVTLNASNQVTPVSAGDDDIIGVLSDQNDMSEIDAGEQADVHVAGIVVGNVATGVTMGSVVQADGVNAGRGAANAQGTVHSVDEGGTAAYDLAPANPLTFSDEAGTFKGAALAANAAAVRLR